MDVRSLRARRARRAAPAVVLAGALILLGASPALGTDRADVAVSLAPSAGCVAEGVLTVDVPYSTPVDYLSYRTNADGTFQVTTDADSALRVAMTFAGSQQSSTLLVIDDRSDAVAVGGYVPPDDPDQLFGEGNALGDYLLIGAATSTRSDWGALETVAGSRTGSTKIWAFGDDAYRPYLLYPMSGSMFGAKNDSWLTADHHLIYPRDKTGYEAVRGSLSLTSFVFDYTRHGARCPGTYVGAVPAGAFEEGYVPPRAGEAMTFDVTVYPGGSSSWLGGTTEVFVCGPTAGAEECDDGELVASFDIPLTEMTGVTEAAEFVVPEAGTYCVRVAYVGSGPDDASATDLDHCVTAAASATPLPTATSSPTPGSSAPGLGSDDDADDDGSSFPPLLAVLVSVAVLAAAIVVVLLVRRRRLMRTESPVDDDPDTTSAAPHPDPE